MAIDPKNIHRQIFTKGINTVLAAHVMPNDMAAYILNCNTLSTSSGKVGAVTNVKGNLKINNTLPSGENLCLGYTKDEERNHLYYFNWNSNKKHGIYRYDILQNKVVPIIINLDDTGDLDILRFNKLFRINHADVYRGCLYWVDGFNPARKTNISKCMDKSEAGYGVVIKEEFINAYKPAPIFAPSAKYFSDSSKPFNRVYGRLVKFIARFIYTDGEKSNWSDYGNVPLPSNEPTSGIVAILEKNNGVAVTVETGSLDVAKIEIAFQATDSSIQDGVLDFRLITTLDKKALKISNDSTYVYKFYNDGSYPVTDKEKVIRPYSFLPKNPFCQSLVKNAIVYTHFDEGFESVEIDAEIVVDYQDLYLDPGIENQLNSPVFVRTAHDVAHVGGKRSRRTFETIAIGSDVKKGNVFHLLMKAPPETGLSTSWSYTATAFDTSLTVANYFRQRISEWGVNNGPYPSPSEISVDSNQTASFNYALISTEYFDGIPTVTPIQFTTLKDTGESVPNTKLGSSLKFGIFYEDNPDGRKSPVYTNDAMVVGIKSINELQGFKKVVIEVKIKHKPPVWAKYYQLVRSTDLIYGSYIQMLIQDVISVQASSNGDYLDLVVGSLFTYQKIHKDTVINYEFQKGDRIRLISSFNVDSYAQTYYPFYEAEVLSYKSSIEEVYNEKITVGANSTTVTIDGTAKDDQIGRVIVIDNVERTIVGRPSGNSYTIDRAIYEDERKFATYKIIDRRGTIRIKKPPVSVISEVKRLSLVEVYKPYLKNEATDGKIFFPFGRKFPIINAGTASRVHAGMSQDQTADDPAILLVDTGTAYIRNRELPTTNVVPGANIIVSAIEDEGFSDYYSSAFNDNGRITAEDNGTGVVSFGSRARYSNNSIEDTSINGLNDFDNGDREDYNDQYGDVMLTYFDQNKLYMFKYLKDTWVPVGQTIMSQADGTPVVGLSSKLLGQIQYYAREGGIGNYAATFATNSTHMYYVSPNSGVVVRLGGNGGLAISELYNLDNEVRRRLQDAMKNGADIIGGFDRENGLYVFSILEYLNKVYEGAFNAVNWITQRRPVPTVTEYQIVTNPSHGTVAFTSTTQWTYTPTSGYVGHDSFSYRAKINGVWSSPNNVCIEVTAYDEPTAWRAKASTAYCIQEDEINTGYQSWTTLEEYGLVSGEPMGNEKPNIETDDDYAYPVLNETACPVTFEFRWEVEEDTAYCENNTIVINDFDYLVARYFWLPGAGTDLDTATGFLNTGVAGIDNNWVGWSNGYTVPGNSSSAPSFIDNSQYLQHSGDNTGTGAECVLIRFAKFAEDYPSAPSPIQVGMFATWFSSRGTGDAKFELIAYKGGNMVKNGFEFENDTPGTEVFRQTFTKNVTATSGTPINAPNVLTQATRLGTISFDPEIFTAILNQD